MKFEEISIELYQHTEDFLGDIELDYTGGEEEEDIDKDEILKSFIEYLSYQMTGASGKGS